MALRVDRCLSSAGISILVLLTLVACSAEKRKPDTPQVGVRASTSETPEIVPSPAYGYHQLRLGSDVSAASFGGLTGADKGQLVIWAINGENVFTGPSLDPSYTTPGDRVTAIVKAADETGAWRELSRHETVILNSAPRVQEVHLQRDSSNPYLIHAVLRADDPDGQKLQIRYRWFVNNELAAGQETAQLMLDAGAVGAKVRVEVVALDDESQSELVSSPTMEIEGPTVFLELAPTPGVTELPGGAREYSLAFESTPGARVEFLDAPASVSRRAGEIVWRPEEGETQLQMRVRVLGADGSSTEREVRLQL